MDWSEELPGQYDESYIEDGNWVLTLESSSDEESEAATDMGRSEEMAGQYDESYTEDEDCFFTLRLSSDEESKPVEKKRPVRRRVTYVVNNPKSDDENTHKKKKTKTCEINSEAGSGRKCGPPKKKPSSAKAKVETGKSICKIPGCFLRDLDDSKYSGKYFKQHKDELLQKIYELFNRTVFDEKMPETVEVLWNKKMLRTAGLCTTSEKEYPKRERHAKIEISPKVCDSADRLRDTLIHEMCHAASWLLDGIRDSHGEAWKYYARKANSVHPELPGVTRCHNYKINYRIHYECTQCKARIGRYTRSLNTDHYICALCKGPLVLLPLTRKDGTPIEPHVRPFAKYVQENYRKVRQESAELSHTEVMRKLSRDYSASKQKKNQ